MRKWWVAYLCYSLCWAPAQANDWLNAQLPNAQIVGQGRLSYWFWDVYDAVLHAPNGEWRKDKPFALRLHYLMEIEGIDIADRSAQEIRALGFDDEVKLAAWHSQMREIFPTVSSGSELTGVYQPGKPTRFYHGAKQVGVISDVEFGQWFFGIWLAENTSEPKLRQQLLEGK